MLNLRARDYEAARVVSTTWSAGRILSVRFDEGELVVDLLPYITGAGAMVTTTLHVPELMCDGFASCTVTIVHTEWLVAQRP
jgi:hypothetical protein